MPYGSLAFFRPQAGTPTMEMDSAELANTPALPALSSAWHTLSEGSQRLQEVGTVVLGCPLGGDSMACSSYGLFFSIGDTSAQPFASVQAHLFDVGEIFPNKAAGGPDSLIGMPSCVVCAFGDGSICCGDGTSYTVLPGELKLTDRVTPRISACPESRLLASHSSGTIDVFFTA